jgi:hypothetical protein
LSRIVGALVPPWQAAVAHWPGPAAWKRGNTAVFQLTVQLCVVEPSLPLDEPPPSCTVDPPSPPLDVLPELLPDELPELPPDELPLEEPDDDD